MVKTYHIFREFVLKSEIYNFKIKASYLEEDTEFIIHYKNGSYVWKYSKTDVEKYASFEQSVNDMEQLEMYVFFPTDLLKPLCV